jgi:hypothetical protein
MFVPVDLYTSGERIYDLHKLDVCQITLIHHSRDVSVSPHGWICSSTQRSLPRELCVSRSPLSCERDQGEMRKRTYLAEACASTFGVKASRMVDHLTIERLG